MGRFSVLSKIRKYDRMALRHKLNMNGLYTVDGDFASLVKARSLFGVHSDNPKFVSQQTRLAFFVRCFGGALFVLCYKRREH